MGCDTCDHDNLPCASECDDNLACLPCPADTYQPVAEPSSTTPCLPCPTVAGRMTGTIGERNTDSDQCIGKYW